MGADIQDCQFTNDDFLRFHKNLRKETATLLHRFNLQDVEKEECQTMGIELECWLTDLDGFPAAKNQTILGKINHEDFVSELSQYNLEINLPPLALQGSCFTEMERTLEERWRLLDHHCQEQNLQAAMTGSLPTLDEKMLGLEAMSQCIRYEALNREIMRLRKQKPVQWHIEGVDRIDLFQDNVMLEAAATSLQVHHSLPAHLLVRQYNAAVIASAPMAALCANSPFVFGKELWDETRIPIMEQSLNLPGFHNVHQEPIRRVTLGSGYLRNSIMELYIENLDAYPILLPVEYRDEPQNIKHVNLHNGSIWRWNRPIIHKDDEGMFKARIEHRVPSSGPSLCDVVANSAFFIGLSLSLISDQVAPETRIPFEVARQNFYQAAKYGLSAEVIWLDGRTVSIREILKNELVPRAEEGLRSIQIPENEIASYITDIIKNRVETGQNGANFQKLFIRQNPGDFKGLNDIYSQYQKTNTPVYRWNI